jgi:oligopeptide transport system ATP-binding protein
MNTLLNVRDLEVEFRTYAGVVRAVRQVSFDLNAGEVLAIVGESGCGKSVTAQSIMRLIPSPPGKITGGSILFNGEEILAKTETQMQKIRGNDISVIFQDSMTSLNPVLNVRTQITEILRLHKKMNQSQADARAIELLSMVGIPEPQTRLKSYPHELSGGMRQRVLIAMSLACDPKLLIADEPTTALDVTIQAQIIEVLKNIRQELNTAIILITHDLGVVAGLADRVMVMYAGNLVEQGTVDEVLCDPLHPYTWGLLRSLPRLNMGPEDKLKPIWGQPPDLLLELDRCPFLPRCEHAMAICAQDRPPAFNGKASHTVNCWLQHPMAPPTSRPQEVG